MLNAEALLKLQELVRGVPTADAVVRYAVRLAAASRPNESKTANPVHKYISYGASPRASQYLVLAAKGRAILAGRYHVDFADVRAVAKQVLRHRLVLNFHARVPTASTRTPSSNDCSPRSPRRSRSAMAWDARELVDPAFFSRLESIQLRARSIVEGFLHGLHRSPYIGFSAEFSSHHEYVAGDDPRHVDWKVFARQRRLYVKEYSAETNLNLYLMLDVSGSMECANAGQSKLRYGSALAAALAHLALKQHDAAGITLFADEVIAHLPPRAKPQQLDDILFTIATNGKRPVSNASRALHQAAELAVRRGIVVLISDLFDEVDAIVSGLDHLRYRNHEVIVLHVLDPWERYLPLEGNIRFRDLESGEHLTTRAESVREAYRQAIDRWRATLDTACRNRAVERIEITTDEPVDRVLLSYLVKRTKNF